MNRVWEMDWHAYPPEPWPGGVLAIGNFDGVHRGHAALLQAARQLADDAPVVAVTFQPHPMKLLAPDKYQLPLMRWQDRATHLLEAGADHVVVLQTSPELLSLEPHAFFETILHRQLRLRGLVEGFNFRFGRGRAGDNTYLKEACQDVGVPFVEVPAFCIAGEAVSTSRIRTALQAGDITTVLALLGRYPAVKGVVGTGAQRGRTIGFPTANLMQSETILPGDGVYAAWANVPAGRFAAAVNIGPNPTFGENARKVEAHLLDFQGDLYGQPLQLTFHARLRPTQPFPGVDALLQQIRTDVAAVKPALAHTTETHR
jgi:riboflavin kinase / FMN adenylyltransferase